MVAQSYRKNYGIPLLQEFNQKLDPWYRPQWIFGQDLQKTIRIFQSGGLSVAEQFYYAMVGISTDEPAVRAALADLRAMTLEQIAQVDADYQALSGETLRVGLRGDLSGRDWFDAQQALRGRPTSLRMEVDRLLESVGFDRWNGTGIAGGDISNADAASIRVALQAELGAAVTITDDKCPDPAVRFPSGGAPALQSLGPPRTPLLAARVPRDLRRGSRRER